MNVRCLQLFAAMCCVTLCSGQVANGPRWWETITTTAPDTRDPDLLPFYDDLVDESHVCCECVPYYLCSDNNTIIADGGHIIGPRFGGTTRVQNVEMCPNVTMLCCRLPSAPVNCDIKKTLPPLKHILHGNPTTANVSHRRVAAPTLMQPIEDQRCNGIRNQNGISLGNAGFKQGESQFGEFPWAGMVLRKYFEAGTPMYTFIGGAIIIHRRVMLTAAHTVFNETTASLFVRVGEWDIDSDYEHSHHQVLSVEEKHEHGRFDSNSRKYDVAVLILSEAIVFYPHIRSICLVNSLDVVDQSACVVNSWGKDDTGTYQPKMKSITLPLLQTEQCQKQIRKTRLGQKFRLHRSFICAGGEEGIDACLSSAGGPLACPRLGSRSGEYLLVGITTWGIGCRDESVPGVHASIMTVKGWIMALVAGRFPDNSVVGRETTDSVDEEIVHRADTTEEFAARGPTTPILAQTTSATNLSTTTASTPAMSAIEVPTTTEVTTTTKRPEVAMTTELPEVATTTKLPEETTMMRWSSRREKLYKRREGRLAEALRLVMLLREKRRKQRDSWRH